MRKPKRQRKLISLLAAASVFTLAVAVATALNGCDSDESAPNANKASNNAPAATPQTPIVAPATNSAGDRPGAGVPDSDRFQDVVGPVTPDRNVAKVIQTLPVFNRPASSAVSLDKKFLFVTNSASTSFGMLYYQGAISKLEIQPDGRLRMIDREFVKDIHAPLGIAVLPKATGKFPAGSLFVCTGATSGCDDKNDRITEVKKFNPGVSVIDPDSGKLIGFIPMGPGRAVAKSIYFPVLAPTGIVFDPKGNLYVADTGNTGKELEPKLIGHAGILRIRHQHIDNFADDKDSPSVSFVPASHEPASIFYSKVDDALYWSTSDGKGPAGGGVYRIPPENFPQQNMVQNILGGADLGPLMGVCITPKGSLIASRLDGELALMNEKVIDRVRFFEDGSFSSPAEVKLHILKDGYNILYVPEQEPNATEPWKQRLRVILLPSKL